MKRMLGLSGGSTKGIGTLAICEELDKKGIEFDTIFSISIGSIIAIPIAMKKFGDIFDIFSKITMGQMFSHPPVNADGKFRWQSLLYLLKFKTAVGNMGGVRDLIMQVVDEDTFEEYKNGQYAVCYAMSVDARTGNKVIANLKECSYEEHIEYIMGSASIPIFTVPIEIDGKILYDGGLRDHVGSHIMLDGTYDECYTIFTRPDDYTLDLWEPKNALDVLERTIDIMNNEISKNDEFVIDAKCKEFGIKNYKFHLPRILTSLYDTDRARLMDLYLAGKKIGEKFYPN